MATGYCQACGFEAPTRSATFYKQTGMLVVRQTGHISGELCRDCIGKYFSEYTLHSALLGWWGVISFIANPFYLGANVICFLTTRSLEPVPPGAGPPQLTEEIVEKIGPFTGALAEGLKAKNGLMTVAHSVAAQAGVTPGQVVAYVQMLSRRGSERAF